MRKPKSTLLLLAPAMACCLFAAVAQDSGQDAEAADVTPPQVILQTQKPPVFPPAALAARLSGVVSLKVAVLKDGSVGKIEVVDCSHPKVGFEQAAVEAVKKWRFDPGMREDEAVDYDLSFRLNFRGGGPGEQPHVSTGPTGEGLNTQATPGLAHKSNRN